MITNVTDALVPLFSGDKQWDEALADACELFRKTFDDEPLCVKNVEKLYFRKLQ